MKSSCTSILLIVAMQSLSQEIKLSPAIGLGIATGQMRKTFFFAKDLHVGAEWSMGKLWALSISVGGSSAQFTYSDTPGMHVFTNRSSLNIPIALRKYNPLSPRSSYFIELGLAPTFQLGERTETRAEGEVRVERFRESTRAVSVVSSIGFNRAVDGRSSISLGFNNYIELVNKDKLPTGKLRQNKILLALVFYRTLTSKPKSRNIEPL